MVSIEVLRIDRESSTQIPAGKCFGKERNGVSFFLEIVLFSLGHIIMFKIKADFINISYEFWRENALKGCEAFKTFNIIPFLKVYWMYIFKILRKETNNAIYFSMLFQFL